MDDTMNLGHEPENENIFSSDPVLHTDAARRAEEAILNEEPSRTIRRKKKKQQLPKWQRMLWKYWPPHTYRPYI